MLQHNISLQLDSTFFFKKFWLSYTFTFVLVLSIHFFTNVAIVCLDSNKSKFWEKKKELSELFKAQIAFRETLIHYSGYAENWTKVPS